MYSLLPLPYDYGALEPYIDTRIMELHHNKHQKAYIDNLNKALEHYPDLQKTPLIEILQDIEQVPEKIRTAVRNNGGGNLNHSMFWLMMKKDGGGEPKGKLAEDLKKRFETFAAFKDLFSTTAKTVFGSGWAWLCVDRFGDLIVVPTKDQDSPYSYDLTPILGLDVWEHAYYLQYENRRPDYIKAWWHVVNWDQVEENYLKVI